MPLFAELLQGLADVFTLAVLLAILAGVAISQFVGALPGIGPVMVMAVAIPYTLAFDPIVGISFLLGAMKGGTIGGAIPAILFNTPGTPDTAMTTLDGYPMAQNGKAKKALRMAVFSSVTGDTFSDIVLITVSAPLALIALRMGPVEIFSLMVLAFAVIAGLSGKSIGKAISAAGLGLLLATVGLDPEDGTPRLYFGVFELFDGIPKVPLAIGVLVMAEVLHRLTQVGTADPPAVDLNASNDPADHQLTFAEYWACRYIMFRGAIIGTLIGALPGIGSTAAATLSYTTAREAAKDHSGFGKGDIRGLAAVESANSAVAGSNLIPLLSLGIPGSVTAALVLSAMLVHGIQPGPLIFEQQGRLVYGIFCAMLVANAINFAIGLFGWRLWARVAAAPQTVIFASAILLCIAGSSVVTGGIFGLVVLIGATVLGVVMKLLDFPVIIFIITFFLGRQFERSYGQMLTLTEGNPANLIEFPVAIALLTLAFAFLSLFAIRRR